MSIESVQDSIPEKKKIVGQKFGKKFKNDSYRIQEILTFLDGMSWEGRVSHSNYKAVGKKFGLTFSAVRKIHLGEAWPDEYEKHYGVKPSARSRQNRQYRILENKQNVKEFFDNVCG